VNSTRSNGRRGSSRGASPGSRKTPRAPVRCRVRAGLSTRSAWGEASELGIQVAAGERDPELEGQGAHPAQVVGRAIGAQSEVVAIHARWRVPRPAAFSRPDRGCRRSTSRASMKALHREARGKQQAVARGQGRVQAGLALRKRKRRQLDHGPVEQRAVAQKVVGVGAGEQGELLAGKRAHADQENRGRFDVRARAVRPHGHVADLFVGIAQALAHHHGGMGRASPRRCNLATHAGPRSARPYKRPDCPPRGRAGGVVVARPGFGRDQGHAVSAAAMGQRARARGRPRSARRSRRV
jgi:hypothetical protein